jgi:hypothetical protein
MDADFVAAEAMIECYLVEVATVGRQAAAQAGRSGLSRKAGN